MRAEHSLSGTTIRQWTLRVASILFGVIAIVGISASSAQAACSPDDQAAYDIFLVVAEFGFAVDQEFDTDPDEKDCEKICKTTGKLCETAAKDITKAEKNIAKSLVKAAKTLCASSASDKACKDDLKAGSKEIKDALKLAQKELEESCSEQALETECTNVCSNETVPATCDAIFGGIAP